MIKRTLVIAAAALTAAMAVPVAAHARPVPRCRVGALSVAVSRAGAAGGWSYYRLRFASSAAAVCGLSGYPGVSFVSRSGRRVGVAAVRVADWPARTVVLRPGGSVWARVGVAAAGNYPPAVCRPVVVHRLRVYPPGSFGSRVVGFGGSVCSSRSVRDLTITPVRGNRA